MKIISLKNPLQIGLCNKAVAFGQVETRNEYLEIINVWSTKMIVIGCLIILNGLGLGYLILKISCILRNQEILLNEKR
nr:hypothetical protein [Acinetobacter baumannii]